jgi:RNA polymerase sigma-70 factor (ECF subfamily)
MSHSLSQVQDQLVALLPRLRRFARSLTRHPADADDLVQTALERALMRLEQWQAGSRLDSWMFGIIHNAWIDEVRARRRRGRVMTAQEAGEHVADAASDAPIQRLSLQAAFQQLDEEQREAVLLVLVEGLSYKEAAGVLNVPIGTISSRIARGRESLEAMLGGREGGLR